MKYIVIVGIIVAVAYGLYLNGIAISYSKVALVFIRDLYGKKATFSKCSAHQARILRVKENGIYHFRLNCTLEEGSLVIKVLGSNKEVLCVLDQDHVEVDIELKKSINYKIDYVFSKATGRYELEYEKKAV